MPHTRTPTSGTNNGGTLSIFQSLNNTPQVAIRQMKRRNRLEEPTGAAAAGNPSLQTANSAPVPVRRVILDTTNFQTPRGPSGLVHSESQSKKSTPEGVDAAASLPDGLTLPLQTPRNFANPNLDAHEPAWPTVAVAGTIGDPSVPTDAQEPAGETKRDLTQRGGHLLVPPNLESTYVMAESPTEDEDQQPPSCLTCVARTVAWLCKGALKGTHATITKAVDLFTWGISVPIPIKCIESIYVQPLLWLVSAWVCSGAGAYNFQVIKKKEPHWVFTRQFFLALPSILSVCLFSFRNHIKVWDERIRSFLHHPTFGRQFWMFLALLAPAALGAFSTFTLVDPYYRALFAAITVAKMFDGTAITSSLFTNGNQAVNAINTFWEFIQDAHLWRKTRSRPEKDEFVRLRRAFLDYVARMRGDSEELSNMADFIKKIIRDNPNTPYQQRDLIIQYMIERLNGTIILPFVKKSTWRNYIKPGLIGVAIVASLFVSFFCNLTNFSSAYKADPKYPFPLRILAGGFSVFLNFLISILSFRTLVIGSFDVGDFVYQAVKKRISKTNIGLSAIIFALANACAISASIATYEMNIDNKPPTFLIPAKWFSEYNYISAVGKYALVMYSIMFFFSTFRWFKNPDPDYLHTVMRTLTRAVYYGPVISEPTKTELLQATGHGKTPAANAAYIPTRPLPLSMPSLSTEGTDQAITIDIPRTGIPDEEDPVNPLPMYDYGQLQENEDAPRHNDRWGVWICKGLSNCYSALFSCSADDKAKSLLKHGETIAAHVVDVQDGASPAAAAPR